MIELLSGPLFKISLLRPVIRLGLADDLRSELLVGQFLLRAYKVVEFQLSAVIVPLYCIRLKPRKSNIITHQDLPSCTRAPFQSPPSRQFSARRYCRCGTPTQAFCRQTRQNPPSCMRPQQQVLCRGSLQAFQHRCRSLDHSPPQRTPTPQVYPLTSRKSPRPFAESSHRFPTRTKALYARQGAAG